MNESNLSSICQNSFNSFVLTMTMVMTMTMTMMMITLTGKLLWKLDLPQSYSPMHCSRRKDCTAQKTIQPNKGGNITKVDKHTLSSI